MSAVNSVVLQHPLLAKAIRRIRDWVEWKGKWEAAGTVEEHLGLLHVGFGVSAPGTDFVDRIRFYLEIADGYRDSETFWTEAGEVQRRRTSTVPEFRREVARKAWKMLAGNVLKNTAAQPWHTPSWVPQVIREVVFQKILWFFTVRGCSNVPLRENGEHEDEIGRTFLLEFAEFVWRTKWPEQHFGYDEWEKILQMLSRERPHVVTILDAMGEINFLLYRWITVDEESVQKLKEIAFRKRHVAENYGTLAEAYHDGSVAAGVFLLLTLRHKGEERLQRIEEAKRRRQEAEEELRRLGNARK